MSDLSQKSTEQLKAEVLVLKNSADKLFAKNPDSPMLAEFDQLGTELAAEIDRREPPRPMTVQGMGGGTPKTKLYGLTAEGQRIPIYSRDERMAPAGSEGEGWLSSFVRNSMGLGGKKIQNLNSGASTVPISVSMQIFDTVRAKARLIQAGSLTIPISGPTNFIKITGDATVSQHAEGTDDISESAPTFGSITGNPETLACLVPLSLELVADSPNLDAALNLALAGAFAEKLDALGIATLLADANIPESSVSHATDAWAGVLLAVTAALGANQDIPAALIANEGDYMARASQLASTAGSWLGAPPVLRGMQDLPTTSMTVGYALMGDFSKGCAVLIRQDLRLELVRWGKPGYGSHLLAAYARMQVYSTQPKALFRQIDTVA